MFTGMKRQIALCLAVLLMLTGATVIDGRGE